MLFRSVSQSRYTVLDIATVRDLATTMKIVIVPIPPKIVTKINEATYQSGTIPAKTYENQNETVPSITMQNFLVTHEGVSNNTIYTMTKSMFDNLDQIVAAHATAKTINKENATKSSPVPLHPKAEKYYHEANLLK